VTIEGVVRSLPFAELTPRHLEVLASSVGAEFGSKHSVSCHAPGRDTDLAMTVEGEAPIVRWLNDAIGMQSPREG
jgi:hypothetical protein